MKILPFNQLSVEKLTYTVDDKAILKNVSFTVNANEKVLLMAPSGFGKTTLLRLLVGQLKPTSGSIIINQSTNLMNISLNL